jgi:hypothetical protein
MSSRVLLYVLAAVLLSIIAAQPVRAATEYRFSATIAEGGTSFGLGTPIEFIGILTDPAVISGEGALASEIEVARLSIGGVSQDGVASAVVTTQPNRLELAIQFFGTNNPDIAVKLEFPGGIEAEFPEVDFDLAEVALVTAEINEDGILPKALNLTSFSGTALSERVTDGGFDDPAHPAWAFEKYDVSSTIAWSSEDAAGSPTSGSLSLDKAVGENPNSLRAGQCIEFVPGAAYALSGTLFWPSASTEGDPFLSVSFHTDPECGGDNVTTASASIGIPPRDVWTPIPPTLIAEVPSGAGFGLLYAGVVAHVDVGSPNFFAASWDDISVVPEPGASAAIAALAVLASLSRRRRSSRA